MVTVLKSGPFRVVIFTDDHEPAHVHVFGDGHAKINLLGPDGAPLLMWAQGFKRSDVRVVMTLVTEKQDELLNRWREIHG